MPRLSPQELQEAKRRKAEERAQEEERGRIEADERAEQRRREAEQKIAQEKMEAERRARLGAEAEQCEQIQSVVDGLYDEADKLCKKWPTMPVSQLTLDRVNRSIKAAKGLLKDEDDPFATEIAEIVPAGDLPEVRDTVLVLREVKDAINRYHVRRKRELARLEAADLMDNRGRTKGRY